MDALEEAEAAGEGKEFPPFKREWRESCQRHHPDWTYMCGLLLQIDVALLPTVSLNMSGQRKTAIDQAELITKPCSKCIWRIHYDPLMVLKCGPLWQVLEPDDGGGALGGTVRLVPAHLPLLPPHRLQGHVLCSDTECMTIITHSECTTVRPVYIEV